MYPRYNTPEGNPRPRAHAIDIAGQGHLCSAPLYPCTPLRYTPIPPPRDTQSPALDIAVDIAGQGHLTPSKRPCPGRPGQGPLKGVRSPCPANPFIMDNQ